MLDRFWEAFERVLKPLVTLSILVLIATLIYEYAVPFFSRPLTEAELHWLHDIELAAILVLAVEVGLAIYRAEDKKKYILENWLLIVSLIPFASSVRVLRFLRVVRVQGGTALKLIKIWIYGSRVIRFFRPVVFFFSKWWERISQKFKK